MEEDKFYQIEFRAYGDWCKVEGEYNYNNLEYAIQNAKYLKDTYNNYDNYRIVEVHQTKTVVKELE
jgi:hypothetical protein